MNVTCPECQSIFRVDPARVPAGGVRARCSVCGGVMAVEAPAAGDDGWTVAAASAAADQASTPAAVGAVTSVPGWTAPAASGAAPPEPSDSTAGEPAVNPPVPPRGLTPWDGLPTTQTASGGDRVPRVTGSQTVLPEARNGELAASASARASAPAGLSGVPTASRPTPFPPPNFTPSTGRDGETAFGTSGRASLGPSPFEPPASRASTGAASAGPRSTGSTSAVGPAWWAAQGIAGPPAPEVAAGAPPAAPPLRAPEPPVRSESAADEPSPFEPLPAPRMPTPAMPAVPEMPTAEPRPVSGAYTGVPARAPVAVPSAASAPAASVATPATGPRPPINPFLANDPNAKAKRLARALVSDMITYHPQLREQAAREGTLRQAFKEEIKKSYEEYVEQVGREFAESTAHFQDALNDILGGGRKLF